MGKVEIIGARSTEIRTLDGISLIVPNSRFLESEVINWSHRNPVSRIHLSLGVAYHYDVNLVKLALLEAASNCSEVLSYPAPQVLFQGFGDSALQFELLVWIADPSKQSFDRERSLFRDRSRAQKISNRDSLSSARLASAFWLFAPAIIRRDREGFI